jgi:hypothetical protein
MPRFNPPDAQRRQQPWRRRWRDRWRRWIVAGVLALLTLLAADYYLYPLWAPIGGRSFNHGDNGLWLHYDWYFGTAKESIPTLAQRLKAEQIRWAYFHVRFIGKSGKLRYRHPEFAKQLAKLRAALADPSIKLIAWIYIGNERGITGVDLADARVRAAIAGEARWLVHECGFDGVQYDYELCADGDADFLKLLRETRAQLKQAPAKPALLSVATPMWLAWPFRYWGWSDEYFARVAALCDQMAVMGYDSGLYLPRQYVWLMRQQAMHVTRAAAHGNPQCRVLLGVPTYKDSSPSHHVHTENLRMALKGVREGMATNAAVPGSFSGVAIFADYTTNPAEWLAYRQLWLGH